MTEQLHRQDFAAYLNTPFAVLDDDPAPCDLELIEVSEETRAWRQETFSVLFRGPAEHFLPQRIYRLRHATLGEAEIFLAPVGQDDRGFHYQAVFNRLISA